VELENQLEQEQEALVNRLWKRMDKLEAEKRCCACCSVIYIAMYSYSALTLLVGLQELHQSCNKLYFGDPQRLGIEPFSCPGHPQTDECPHNCA